MSLHYPFLSKKDMDQMDALKESYGGAAAIEKSIAKMRDYPERKKVAGEKGFGEMLEMGEKFGHIKILNLQKNIQSLPN